MKNNKKDFNKFSSREKTKQRAKRELMRMVEELNVGTKGTKIQFSEESSSRGRRESDIITEGVFSETAAGYGFVALGNGKRDVFIPENYTRDALDSDTVKISYRVYRDADGEERTEGRILEVTEYGRKCVIGTVDSETVRIHKRRIERLFIIPDDGKIKRRIYLRETLGAERGDKVVARLVRGASYTYSLEADVTENLGDTYSKEANYAAILLECGIDTEFSNEELTLAKKQAAMPLSDEGRVVRDEVIFTIDSESAKDLDDAVSVKKLDTGWELGVHIADVSLYVPEKSALDRLVMARGNSVYFTDKVVPMLPESLSNGACSLSPGTEKYTLSAILTIDHNGSIKSTRVEPSIIKSRVKGIYSEINAIFDGTAESEITDKYRELLPTLYEMKSLYEVLAKKSVARGALELDSPEAQVLLNESGEPCAIVRRERGVSERLIEQFMLAANEGVATLLGEAGIPCVYRVHEAPPEDKLSSFITYAHNLGFDTKYISHDKCTSKDLQALLDEARARGIGEPLSYACLRSMSRAEYSDVCLGHYGLSIKNYCHFTSPIRRLSDLATHRIIRAVLIDDKSPERYRAYAKRAAAAATEGENRAVNAERRIEALYKVIYMSGMIGENFEATVSSVASFGFFATLENTCEGLVPISTLDDDYFFDEGNLSLRSKTKNIRIGDRVKVRLEEADILRGKLRFSYLGGIGK